MTEPDGSKIKLEDSWKMRLKDEFDQAYMKELRQFLITEKRNGKTIYPAGDLIFNALNSTPFDQVKVVVLGQDPYHGVGQAHGLCFSVKPGVAVPRSLANIYKEMQSDIGCNIPSHGYLGSWAKQGVLLLNAVLTVEASKAAAHEGN
jgi:uracil-DNA glycosylase